MITYKANLPIKSDRPQVPPKPPSLTNATDGSQPRFHDVQDGIMENGVKTGGDEPLFVIISSPAHGVHSTIRASKNTAVSEVIKLFLKRNPVENQNDWALFINRDSLVQMDSNMLLSVYKLKKMEELIYRTKTHSSRPAGGVAPASQPMTLRREKLESTNPESSASKQFGGELDKMEFEFDPDTGKQIPRALLQLKHFLVTNDGLAQLGIFRLAGHESRMKEVILQIETNTFQSLSQNYNQAEKDFYTIASLIKRWFDMLKPRLFSYLPPGTVETCGVSESSSLSLPELLPECPRNVFYWLIDLLASVALLEEKNKMASKNLSIVLAPPLLDFPIDNPIAGLELSGRVTNTLNHILKNAVENKQKGVSIYTSSNNKKDNNSYNYNIQASPTPPARIPPPAPPRDVNGTIRRQGSNAEIVPESPKKQSPMIPERKDILLTEADERGSSNESNNTFLNRPGKNRPQEQPLGTARRRRENFNCPPPVLEIPILRSNSLPNLEEGGGEASTEEKIKQNPTAWWETVRHEGEINEEESYNNEWDYT